MVIRDGARTGVWDPNVFGASEPYRPLAERLDSGETYAIAIELFRPSDLFTSGHRLRLDISSSNFPHFNVNPNSGEPEGAMERPRVARNRVFVDAARPSHIILPVIP